MENERFIIDNDQKADWAVAKIREERKELERLSELHDAEVARLDAELEAARKRCESSTGYLLEELGAYFETVPHRKTKTMEQYRLLSGSLVRKIGGVDYQRDDEALTAWLRQHPDMEDLICTKVTPRWCAVKRLIKGDPVSGVVVFAETGEVVEGLKAQQMPDVFDVKF